MDDVFLFRWLPIGLRLYEIERSAGLGDFILRPPRALAVNLSLFQPTAEIDDLVAALDAETLRLLHVHGRAAIHRVGEDEIKRYRAALGHDVFGGNEFLKMRTSSSRKPHKTKARIKKLLH